MTSRVIFSIVIPLCHQPIKFITELQSNDTQRITVNNITGPVMFHFLSNIKGNQKGRYSYLRLVSKYHIRWLSKEPDITT